MIKPLLDWYESGAHGKDVPLCTEEQGWSMLVLRPGVCDLFTSKAPYGDPCELPYALGSGGDYALGAMHAGASPQQAIEIACRIDTGSGGAIQVIDIAEALGLSHEWTKRDVEMGKFMDQKADKKPFKGIRKEK